jgi:hypothetical protein
MPLTTLSGFSFENYQSIPTSNVLFSDSFTTGDFTKNDGGWAWAVNGGVNPTVVTNFGRTDNNSVKFTFLGTASGGDAFSELRYTFGSSQTEVYFQYYMYYPDGNELSSIGIDLGPRWEHRTDTPNNNKFIRLWGPDSDVGTTHSITCGYSTYQTGGTGDEYPFPEYSTDQINDMSSHGIGSTTFVVDDTVRGRWVKIDMHFKCATSANNDGVYEMWVDDVLVGSWTDLPLYPTNPALNYFASGYILGWSNSGFDIDSYCYMDDFKMSNRPIV